MEQEMEIRRDLTPRPFRSPIFCILHWYRTMTWMHTFLFVCLFVVLPVVYFSVSRDHNFLRQTSNVTPTNFPDEGMREAEQQLWYLLGSQRSGLQRLWNQTFLSHWGRAGSRTSDAALGSTEDFRSSLLEQIKLNTDIQKVLTSTRHLRNASYLSKTVGLGADVCRKRERRERHGKIEWKPMKDRYLYAICVYGKMTNRLICLRKHMSFAALLNRTLVLPSPWFGYQYANLIDIPHINDCVGRKVVISFDEFASLKREIRIDRFVCYSGMMFSGSRLHLNRLENGLNLSMGRTEVAWPGDERTRRSFDDVKSKFSCEDRVLAMGNIFYARVEGLSLGRPGGLLSHTCKALVEPARPIKLTARRFVRTFLGDNFAALHFRRDDFLSYCENKSISCFLPIPEVARCILRVVQKANASVIYISTNSAEIETNILQKLLVLNGQPIPLIRRPAHSDLEKWDGALHQKNEEEDEQVFAMLDVAICTLSKVFIGTPFSSFSGNIFRLRKDWDFASTCDQYLRLEEHPS